MKKSQYSPISYISGLGLGFTVLSIMSVITLSLFDRTSKNGDTLLVLGNRVSIDSVLLF